MNYRDPEALRVESEEGRRLGFDGKVRVHPSMRIQVLTYYNYSKQSTLTRST